MRKVESDCVDCGLPCLGRSCPHYSVTRFYCDKCGNEDTLYLYDDKELCRDCIHEIIDEEIEKNKIEGSYSTV